MNKVKTEKALALFTKINELAQQVKDQGVLSKEDEKDLKRVNEMFERIKKEKKVRDFISNLEYKSDEFPGAIETPARDNEKMIELKIKFFTNNISVWKDYVVKKLGWQSGYVYASINKTHGIESKKPVFFHSLMELPQAIEETLLKQDIKLKSTKRTKEYLIPNCSKD